MKTVDASRKVVSSTAARRSPFSNKNGGRAPSARSDPASLMAHIASDAAGG